MSIYTLKSSDRTNHSVCGCIYTYIYYGIATLVGYLMSNPVYVSVIIERIFLDNFILKCVARAPLLLHN